jgi:hypothetical protein
MTYRMVLGSLGKRALGYSATWPWNSLLQHWREIAFWKAPGLPCCHLDKELAWRKAGNIAEDLRHTGVLRLKRIWGCRARLRERLS